MSPVAAKPGFQAFTAGGYNADGTLNTQAGSHPYTSTAAVFVNTIPAASGAIIPAGDPKTVRENCRPASSATRSRRRDARRNEGRQRMSDRLAGRARPADSENAQRSHRETLADPIHSVEAPVGYPAKYTFPAGEPASIFQVNVVASLRSDEDYPGRHRIAEHGPDHPGAGGLLHPLGRPGQPRPRLLSL